MDSFRWVAATAKGKILDVASRRNETLIDLRFPLLVAAGMTAALQLGPVVKATRVVNLKFHTAGRGTQVPRDTYLALDSCIVLMSGWRYTYCSESQVAPGQ